MTQPALERLSPRQQTCLRMLAAHIGPKQIAAELGISESTVRGYLAEAMQLLNASDLRHAARLFLEHSQSTPLFFGGENHRVATDPVVESLIVPEEQADSDIPPPLAETKNRFHVLRRERRANDLSINERAAWVLVAAILALFLLASSAFALDMITNLVLLIKYNI